MNTFLGFLKDLRSCGYVIHYEMLNAADFSIPQDRKRVFVVGLRDNLNLSFQFLNPHKNKISLRRAIGDICLPPFEYHGRVEELKYNGRFFNHDIYVGPYDFKFMARNRVRGWEEQSFTIQALAKNCPLHPQAPKMTYIDSNRREFVRGKEHLYRRLSIRECARIQTFPDSFKFYYDDIKDGYKMVGNAVPPRLGYHIAMSINKAFLESKLKTKTYCLIGYYKDDNHLNVIRTNRIYNIRFGMYSGDLKIPLGSKIPLFLLLHNGRNRYLFKLDPQEPKTMTKEQLQSMCFDPRHELYTVFSITSEITNKELPNVDFNKFIDSKHLGAKPKLIEF